MPNVANLVLCLSAKKRPENGGFEFCQFYVGAEFCRDGHHRRLSLAAPSIAVPVAARYWSRPRGTPGQHAGSRLLLVSRSPDAPGIWVGHHTSSVPHGHRDWDAAGGTGESQQSPGVFGDCRADTQPDPLWPHCLTAALASRLCSGNSVCGRGIRLGALHPPDLGRSRGEHRQAGTTPIRLPRPTPLRAQRLHLQQCTRES